MTTPVGFYSALRAAWFVAFKTSQREPVQSSTAKESAGDCGQLGPIKVRSVRAEWLLAEVESQLLKRFTPCSRCAIADFCYCSISKCSEEYSLFIRSWEPSLFPTKGTSPDPLGSLSLLRVWFRRFPCCSSVFPASGGARLSSLHKWWKLLLAV